MKLVREHINFKKPESKEEFKDNLGVGKIQELEKRGVYFNLDWDKTGEERNKVIKNIDVIEEYINKLESVGFDIKKIRISHSDGICVKVIQVLDGNRVILECPSKGDAIILIDTILKLSIYNYDQFKLDDGEATIHFTSQTDEWLNNIVENRKKYKNISKQNLSQWKGGYKVI